LVGLDEGIKQVYRLRGGRLGGGRLRRLLGNRMARPLGEFASPPRPTTL